MTRIALSLLPRSQAHQRLLARRHKAADLRETCSLGNFDFSFNPGINRAHIYELDTGPLSVSVTMCS
jgi:hypothetical protein